jgi:hypothetical protein
MPAIPGTLSPEDLSRLVPLAEVPTRFPAFTERHLRRCVQNRRVRYFKLRGRVHFLPEDLAGQAQVVEPVRRRCRNRG